MAAIANPFQQMLDASKEVAKASSQSPLYLTEEFKVSPETVKMAHVSKLILNLQSALHRAKDQAELPLATKIFALLKLISLKNPSFAKGIELSSFEPLIAKTAELASKLLMGGEKRKAMNKMAPRGYTAKMHINSPESRMMCVQMSYLMSMKEYIHCHYRAAQGSLEYMHVLEKDEYAHVDFFIGVNNASKVEEKEGVKTHSFYISTLEGIAFYFRWLYEVEGILNCRLDLSNLDDFKNRFLTHSNPEVRQLAAVCVSIKEEIKHGLYVDLLLRIVANCKSTSVLKEAVEFAGPTPKPFLEFVDISNGDMQLKDKNKALLCTSFISEKLIPWEGSLNLQYQFIYKNHQWMYPGKPIAPQALKILNDRINRANELYDPERFTAYSLTQKMDWSEFPQKPIHRSKIDLRLLPKSEESAAAAAAPVICMEKTLLQEIFDTCDYPEGIVYHPRVSEWFTDPKTALSRPEYQSIQASETREKIRVFHAFSSLVDALVGTSYSEEGTWTNPDSGEVSRCYSIPAQVSFGSQTFYVSIDYTFDTETGICYHRCISEKKVERFLSTWREFDYPTLQRSAKALGTNMKAKKLNEAKSGNIHIDEETETILISDETLSIRLFKIANDLTGS